MKNSLNKTIARIVIAGGVSLVAASAMANGSDNFNRASLGGNWVRSPGNSLSIKNDQLVGKTSSIGYLKGSKSDTSVSAVLWVNGTDLQYGAVALGDVAGGNNAFVKLQSQNGGGTFDHAAFYTGNNGGTDFFELNSPVSSPAILDVSFCGTVATMTITSASGVQTYTNDYGTTYPTGAGAGFYGKSSIDNFVSAPTTCVGATTAVPAVRSTSLPRALDLSHAK
jgi:hypothetical protein